ncbi:thiamine phosphate synthase [Flavisphingomonas formosensis]|uniref:thiamine phosphate synthase n=1 Tax=Flavisphingomonas formosensis TaxID=861534 RepID=UPI001E35DCBE|nr:thiamine phosphate synthase [Sphingomonas formosensis]
MTDERQGETLFPALRALPRGTGVVFRHYRLAPADRRALYERVRGLARRRGLILLLGASPRQAMAWKADGAHGRSPHRSPRPMLRSTPIHRGSELRGAAAGRAELLFLSPVFATRSHPGAPALGPVRFGLLRRYAGKSLIALGGMTPSRARALRKLGAYGWAAIDALSRHPI